MLPLALVPSLRAFLLLTGLTPGTIYHVRVVATNTLGTESSETTFTTFPFTPKLHETCTNGLARQQTGAALLLDCRAYELVSSGESGGYDVESNLVPGQTPYAGYPQASGAAGTSRVLYGVHDGALPGVAGHPTNKGVGSLRRHPRRRRLDHRIRRRPRQQPLRHRALLLDSHGRRLEPRHLRLRRLRRLLAVLRRRLDTGIPVRLASGELVQGMVRRAGFPEPGPPPPPTATLPMTSPPTANT